MPVGAIIGGVSGLAGAIIGGNKNSKAINKASDAQAAASKEATALQRDIYNKNVGFQTPFLNTGNAAMGQINALLGLNVPQGPIQTGGTGALPQAPVPAQQGNSFLQAILSSMGQNGAQLPPQATAYMGQQPQTTGTMPQQQQPTQASATDAYNQFKGFTGYQTRLNEANNALNGAYGARGTLQSGAAMEAMAKMNQDYASNEFQNYMGYLGGQQQLGPGAANALSGVGTNYANAAGNLAIQNGNNIANAAVAKANNFNNTMGNIANVFSNAMGGFGGGF